MVVGLKDFKNLLKSYFMNKNSPERGDKGMIVDDIKNEIYDSYLNEDFGLRSGISSTDVTPADTKVMKEFFSEVEKQGKIYMEDNDVTVRDMGQAAGEKCAKEFIQNFKRKVLLKTEFRNTLTDFQSRISPSSPRSRRAASRKSKKEKDIKTYKRLLKKKRLTKKEDSKLKRLMKRKYCSCLTKVKRSKKVKKGIEYPICLSSIYTKRNKKTPKNPRKICK